MFAYSPHVLNRFRRRWRRSGNVKPKNVAGLRQVGNQLLELLQRLPRDENISIALLWNERILIVNAIYFCPLAPAGRGCSSSPSRPALRPQGRQ